MALVYTRWGYRHRVIGYSLRKTFKTFDINAKLIVSKTKLFVTLQVRSLSEKGNSNLNTLLQSMPKDPKHIIESQKIRKRIKEKSSRYVPGRVTLQILGTGAEGAPRSLYIFSDQSRYLFNCGEGTQRLAHEHKMKLAKLEHIFITQSVWKNIGGLPGTALTIQDVGVPQITLHGPQGLNELFVATKRFVILRDLYVKMAVCDETTEFEDSVMTVRYIPLQRTLYANGLSLNRLQELAAMQQEQTTQSSSTTTDSSICSSSESDQSSSSDSNSFDKDIQASADSKDAATSTRNARKRNRRRRNSQSIGPYVVEDDLDDVDYYAHERKKQRHRRKSRARSQSANRNKLIPDEISESTKLNLSETKEKGTVMCYICKLQPRPGALNLDKCVKYGVPAGPLLGKLKAGEDVTLDSGLVVRSVDVCDPHDPGPVFLIVDCPSEEYLDSFVNNEMFKKHQKFAMDDSEIAHLVVHFTPKVVIEHSRYKQWMKDFSPLTEHIMINDGNSCMGSASVHRIQYKLNMLHPEIFPLLKDNGTEIVHESSDGPSAKKLKTDESCSKEGGETPCIERLSVESRPNTPFEDDYVRANTLYDFHLRPKKGGDRSNELKLFPLQYLEETLNVEGFKQSIQELKLNLLDKRKNLIVRPYPKILFLGTGSCIPNKTRNTSGIFLQTSDTCNILMDCGEGTYGQLVRFFGRDSVDPILCNIKAIYISHLHADHHIGLIGLLLGRRRALLQQKIYPSPVMLFAPSQIQKWLHFYDRCFESIKKEYELIPNGNLNLLEPKIEDDIQKRISNTLDMTEIRTVLVRHCPNAFGVTFKHTSGYKITYSGDTMPCPNLIKLGEDSDLLIHEATMEDDLAGEAVIKMHSTTSQAINVGKDMKAKHVLLTHFSQRYAKLPRFNENFSDNIGIAFDNMQIKLDELPLVPLFYPALKLMFAEHYEELENKAVKRQMRIERQREASRERQSSKQLQKA